MIEQMIKQVFLGNRVGDYLVCVFLFLAVSGAIKLFQHFLLKRLKIWAKKTATTLDDFLVGVIQKILLPLGYLGAFYASINTLKLHPSVQKAVNIAGVAILTLFTARLATALVSYGFDLYQGKRDKDETLKRSLDGILKVLKTVIWGLAIIFFLR